MSPMILHSFTRQNGRIIPLSPVHEISMDCINIHLSPGDIENALFAGHLSCALSEERESWEMEAVGCGRLWPWNSFQLIPLFEGLGTAVGAPPPASSSSGVPGPKRPAKTGAERVRWLGDNSKCDMGNNRRGEKQ